MTRLIQLALVPWLRNLAVAGIALGLVFPVAAQEEAQPRAARPGGPIRKDLQNLRERLADELPPPLPSTEEVPHKLVVLRFSEDFLTSLIDRDVDETTTVSDVILATPVRGNARTTGRPRLDLVADDSQAICHVILEGTTVSRTVGRNGPAVIYSRSTSRFRATKPVVFDPGNGFRTLPTRVESSTYVQTEGIGSTRPGIVGCIVRRRAWREVQATRPQVEAIANQKAQRRIEAIVDRQLEAGLARLNRRGNVRALVAALLVADPEPRYECCSTHDHLQIAASTERRDVPIVLPDAAHLASPVQVWIHHSLLGPTLATALVRLNGSAGEIQELVAYSRTAMAALVGTEVASSVTGNESEPPLKLTHVDDWLILEIGENNSRLAEPPPLLRR